MPLLLKNYEKFNVRITPASVAYGNSAVKLYISSFNSSWNDSSRTRDGVSFEFEVFAEGSFSEMLITRESKFL